MNLDMTSSALRRFSRFYTRQVDLLDEGLLKSPFTLTEARVIYELAMRGPLAARDLQHDLGLDAGYLSRILKGFARQDLVVRTTAPEDGRRSMIALTQAGRDAFAPLDRASAQQASRLLASLTDPDRIDLVDAMARIERLLGGPANAPTLRPHRVGDMGWIIHRQSALYAEEYGWDGSFEALVAEIAAGFLRTFDPDRERCWIAERDGRILGSVFLVRQSDEEAKLRLLYVEPAARGLGLGRTLVRACIAHARATGYRTLTLWTNDILVSARHIYVAEGFVLVSEEAHHSFGHDLVGQYWRLDL